MIKLLVAAFGAFVVIYLASRDWRRSVKAVFLIVVLEGALRKWILPQANELIYFLKDFVLIGAYLRYFFSERERRPIYLDPISIMAVLVSLWAGYEMFNPSLGSPIVGLFGFKIYLLYVPLIWMIPSLFRVEEELQIFLRNHLLLAIPVGLLGLIQYVSPKTSWINAYAPNEGANSAIATFGSAGLATVRITGSFSHVNSYQGYLIACFALLLPMLAVQQAPKWRWATIAELMLVLVNTLMTGSRTPLLAQGAILVGFLTIGLVSQSSKMAFWIQRGIPSMGFVGLGVFLGFRQAVDRFWKRATSSRDLTSRITQNFHIPPDLLSGNNLEGYGVGSTHGATGTLRGLLGLPAGKAPPLAEAEMSRIAIEMGPFGFVLWYGFRVVLIFSLWFTVWRVKRPFLRQLAIAAFFTHLVMLSGQLVFHHTFAIYYWFMGGFIFLLPQLEATEAWRYQQALLLKTYAPTPDAAPLTPPPPHFPGTSYGQSLRP